MYPGVVPGTQALVAKMRSYDRRGGGGERRDLDVRGIPFSFLRLFAV
jgi:hypothetical protein